MPNIAGKDKKKSIVNEVLNKKADPKKIKKKKIATDMRSQSLDKQKEILNPGKKPQAAKTPKKELQAEKVLKLQEIFKERSLPVAMIPKSLTDYKYNPGSGQLEITLPSGFTKDIVDSKGKKSIIKFEGTLKMVLGNKKITNIQGITVPTSHSAKLTSIESAGNQMIRFTGQVAFFSKSIMVKESDLPSL